MSGIRVGVIGLGFGQYHVKTLATMDQVQLVAVADQFNPNLDAYSRKYGVRVYRDGLEMLEREQLDAVTLCVSPRWRLELIQKAAEMDIPMYVEKPWASNVAQARELARICEQSSAPIMVGFAFRYLPVIEKLRELMNGELGRGWALNGEYVFDWLPPAQHWLWDPENGNGFFNENSCHLFDLVCCLMGMPVSVMAEDAVFMGRPSAEMGSIVMRFADGSIATLSVGALGASAFRTFPRINLVTANGQAHISGREHMWETLEWAVREKNTIQRLATHPESLENTRYTYALQHFVNCIRNGIAPTAGVDDGVLAVAIAEAVYKSARTGRKVQMAEYGLKGELQ